MDHAATITIIISNPAFERFSDLLGTFGHSLDTILDSVGQVLQGTTHPIMVSTSITNRLAIRFSLFIPAIIRHFQPRSLVSPHITIIRTVTVIRVST
jgi:hypothetical protein